MPDFLNANPEIVNKEALDMEIDQRSHQQCQVKREKLLQHLPKEWEGGGGLFIHQGGKACQYAGKKDGSQGFCRYRVVTRPQEDDHSQYQALEDSCGNDYVPEVEFHLSIQFS